MKPPFIVTSLLFCLAFPTFAADPLDIEKHQLFERLKMLEKESHQQRIAILEEAEVCISRAENFREYRKCEQKEKQAREEFKQKHKPKKLAFREDFREFRENRISNK